jgi:branched-subunit amino acid aminotransferase/4-amino-4-deoxychorismate lyase
METRSFGPGRGLPPPPPAGGWPRTALPVFEGIPRHLEAHLRRLEEGARSMGLEVPWLASLPAGILAWLQEEASGKRALRLALHPAQGRLEATLEPLPAPPTPCPLLLLPHPLGARRGDPRLVHKGLAGPWGGAPLQAARQAGAADALLTWPDGTLAETTMAAVAMEAGGVLRLPPQRGRVASLAERLEFPSWAAARGLPIRYEDIPLPELREGSLWCMNALRGIWPAALLP